MCLISYYQAVTTLIEFININQILEFYIRVSCAIKTLILKLRKLRPHLLSELLFPLSASPFIH